MHDGRRALAAVILWTAGSACAPSRSSLFAVSAEGFRAEPGELAVLAGNADEGTDRLVKVIEIYLHDHGRLTVLTQDQVKSRWRDYPVDLPRPTEGKYFEARVQIHRADTELAHGLWKRVRARYLWLVWAGGVNIVTDSYARTYSDRVYAQLYAAGPTGATMIGHTEYTASLNAGCALVSAGNDAKFLDQMYDKAAARIAQAMLVRLDLAAPAR